jgi:S-adenosylmethionine-diacylglycerol 3-amino-3-carboxypropyl transferase
MFSFKQTLNQLRDKIFQNIHSNNLIYNTCWEDPRCDREMLQFDQNSKVVMITSAGCNALDYLLDSPAAIHTIDVNSRQNALLELKRALIEYGSFDDLWNMFGEGHYDNAVGIYAEKLRDKMPNYAQQFWDKNIIFFRKKSFYFQGTSGTFAWWFNQYIDLRPNLRKLVTELLEAKDLATQQAVYQEIEPKIITTWISWIVNRHVTMSLLGVPRAQRQLIIDEYPEEKVAGFVRDCLRNVFMELTTSDNYFWRLYLTGKYTRNCCPNYLVEKNYEKLRENNSRIHQHTCTISEFLRNNPDKYSHYILLDHQDWLAAHDVNALIDEWNLILKNSKKGTKILMRSAAFELNFIPDFVHSAVDFDTETTERLHKLDRVGTYASVHLGIVK